MLELYVQLITVGIAILSSLFIVFWPSKDNLSEVEWLRSFQENNNEEPIYAKLVIPPNAFIKSKSTGFTKLLVNNIMMYYKRGRLMKNKTNQSSNNLKIDTDIIEHNGINGAFHLKYLRKDSTPLISFVNSKSGGQKGNDVLKQLSKYLNPQCQIFDLSKISPDKVITPELCSIPGLIILICGGDGTVSWIVNCLLHLKHLHPLIQLPPFCIIPLGTGNDLSYALGKC